MRECKWKRETIGEGYIPACGIVREGDGRRIVSEQRKQITDEGFTRGNGTQTDIHDETRVQLTHSSIQETCSPASR